MTEIRRTTARVLRTIDAENRTVRFCFSDGSVDRMGDTIDPNGWELAEYMRNPVVLFAHDGDQPPIGRTVNGPWSDGSRLLGDVQFAPPEVYEFADTVFKLVKNGYLKSGSVGFLPIAYDRANDDDRPYGIDYKRQSLIEFSIVPVPANSNALAEARAKGLVSRADLARLHQDQAEDDTTRALLREIAELRSGAQRRFVPHEPTPPEMRARIRAEIDIARERSGVRRIDPRVAAAQAAFRLRGW